MEVASNFSTVPRTSIALLPCAIAGTARSATKLPIRRLLNRIGCVLGFRGRSPLAAPFAPVTHIAHPCTPDHGGDRAGTSAFGAFWTGFKRDPKCTAW